MDDRSRPANWLIRPHAHPDLHHVFHIAAGGGGAEADGRLVTFTAPCVLIVPAGVVHGFKFHPESVGTVLTFADAFLLEIAAKAPKVCLPFSQGLWTSPEHGAALTSAIDGVRRELAWTAAGHDLATEAYVAAIIVEVLRLHLLLEQEAAAPAGAQAILVARYREFLERHYREHPSIELCARNLGVSEGRLRSACQNVASASPGKLLHLRLSIEAQRVMRYSNMSVAQIGAYLGFDDPAYFTRFFTRMTQMSPRAFRGQAQASALAFQN